MSKFPHNEELEKNAVEYAEKTIADLRGFHVDNLLWSDSLYGKELRLSYDGYYAGYESAQAEAAALRAELQELKREEKALKYQVTELMEYVAWLGGFERQAMHDSAWERRKELLTRLAASIYTGFAPTERGGEGK